MSEAFVLDTHVLVWLVEGDQRLGRGAREVAQTALKADNLTVSAISFWEIAMLLKTRRLGLALQAMEWRQGILQRGILEVPVTGQIGILAGELTGLPGDPADRIITATALVRNATLVTADERILEWSGGVLRQDARR